MASTTSAPPFLLRDLCLRALSSPSSITPLDRALILNRPEPATEDSLYIAITSLPLSALVTKALRNPPTLTLKEAQVLFHGPVERTREEKAERMQAYRALSDEQRDLLDRAGEAVTDKEEHKAGSVAYRMLRSAKEEERVHQRATRPAAASLGQRQAMGSAQTIVFPWERADWVTLVREKNYPTWGISVLRTAYDDPAAWLAFKTRFSALAAHEIVRLAPDIADSFSINYVDDGDALLGAEQAGLLDCYARMVTEEKVKDGHQWGVFLSADESVLEILSEAQRGWLVPAWEASWTAGKVDQYGWNGALAIRAELVFRILMPKPVRGERQPLESLAMMATGR